jgi:DNA-directed RNA polymerase subunit N (RpoN/RPB10)
MADEGAALMDEAAMRLAARARQRQNPGEPQMHVHEVIARAQARERGEDFDLVEQQAAAAPPPASPRGDAEQEEQEEQDDGRHEIPDTVDGVCSTRPPGRYGLMPVRCFTCHKVISNMCDVWEHWVRRRFVLQRHARGYSDAAVAELQDAVLTKMRMTRNCCRRMFLSQPTVVLPELPRRPPPKARRPLRCPPRRPGPPSVAGAEKTVPLPWTL